MLDTLTSLATTPLRDGHVPVTLGAARSHTVRTDIWRVTEAWFPATTVIADHTHDHASFATMLSGSFETKAGSRRHACTFGRTWTEPAGARHANFVQSRGAHVLVVHAPDSLPDDLRSLTSLFDDRCVFPHGLILCEANRLYREVGSLDRFAGIAAESLIVGMMTTAAASRGRMKVNRDATWLCDAEALLRAHFREPVSLAGISATLGVERSVLAHAFRRRFRRTIGEYLRALRLEWALMQLADTRQSVTEIALAAGFADQSHLTRLCSRHTGLPPGAFRAASASAQRQARALVWQTS